MPSEMKSSSAVVIKIVIVSLILGTALSNPNLEEFCSKQFFDRITTPKEVGDRTVIEFYRQNEAKKGSIHKWKAFLHEITYNHLNISPLLYELMEGQLPDFQLDQPEECPIKINATIDSKFYSWDLWFKLENLPNGTIIRYKKRILQKLKPSWEVYKLGYNWKLNYGDNQTTSISKAENVFMTSLLCKSSKQIIYGIGEDKSQKDGNNRSQYVGIIEVKSTPRLFELKESKFYEFDITPTFNRVTSLKDFLSIDCPKPTSQSVTQSPIPTATPVEEEEEVESITYLLIIFGVLLISGIILIIVDLNVYQMRKRNNSDSERTKESAISKTALDFEGDMHREQ